MHQYHMRFTADLRMNGHRKDKAIIFPICKVKLLEPKTFDILRTHKTMLFLGQWQTWLPQYISQLTVPARPGIGCNGGQSSICQFAGISTTLLGRILVIGFIQKSAGSCTSVSIHSWLESGA